MSYNIYYMYDDATGEGYIGQNKDAQDDVMATHEMHKLYFLYAKQISDYSVVS